jgi:hypothetical protein
MTKHLSGKNLSEVLDEGAKILKSILKMCFRCKKKAEIPADFC